MDYEIAEFQSGDFIVFCQYRLLDGEVDIFINAVYVNSSDIDLLNYLSPEALREIESDIQDQVADGSFPEFSPFAKADDEYYDFITGTRF